MIRLSSLSAELFRKYSAEIKKFPLLNKEQEDELILRKQAGDKKAREKLINCNLRLVLYVLSKSFKRGQEMGRKQIFSSLDLIQLGNIGLIKAVDQVEVRPDSRLKDLALFTIKKEMIREMLKYHRVVRITEQKDLLLKKIRAVGDSLAQRLEREPEIWEIASEIKKDPAIISHIVNISKNVFRLEDILGSENISEVEEILDLKFFDEEDLIKDLLLSYVHQLSYVLSESEKTVLFHILYPKDEKLANEYENLINGYSGQKTQKNAKYNFRGRAIKKVKNLLSPELVKKIMGT